MYLLGEFWKAIRERILFFRYDLLFLVSRRYFGFLLGSAILSVLLIFYAFFTAADAQSQLAAWCGVAVTLSPYLVTFLKESTTPYETAERSKTAEDLYNTLKGDDTVGFETVKLPCNEWVTTSKNLNSSILRQPHISLELFNGDYEKLILNKWHELRSEQREYLIFKINKPGYLFNESKVALVGDFFNADQKAIVAKTSYFASTITNELCGTVVKSANGAKKFYTDNKLPIELGTGHLVTLGNSNMSNHIGITLLVKTSDNQIILWSQTSGAQQNKDEIVATGSGSMDWQDYKGKRPANLLALVKTAMIREAVEESTLNPIQREKLFNDTMVTGYFRWVSRGGKPEFVGIAKTDLMALQFTPERKEVDNVQNNKQLFNKNVRSVDELLKGIESLRESYKISVSLDFLFWQLKEYMEKPNSEEYNKVAEFWDLPHQH